MQMDLIQSAAHFRTPIGTGLEILAALRNRISGMALPHFVVDLPGGRGKVPLLPDSVERIDREEPPSGTTEERSVPIRCCQEKMRRWRDG